MVALKKGKISCYQLPIGILLRCCFTDCLFTLYIQRVGKEKAYEELELRTIEYANSLLERKEVYRDQVKSTGAEFDDAFIDNMWELTMEDNFLGLLTFDDNMEDLLVTKQSNQQLKDSGFTKTKSIATKDILDFLVDIPELKATATRMYHYYRYFSQYEHFSENGQGDVLESEKDDGNDNIHSSRLYEHGECAGDAVQRQTGGVESGTLAQGYDGGEAGWRARFATGESAAGESCVSGRIYRAGRNGHERCDRQVC